MRMQGFTPDELEDLLIEHGWKRARIHSNHNTYTHPDFNNIITIPFHNRKEICRPLAKRLLREANINY